MQGIGIIVSLVLARFLMPSDYGLVAMATGFTGVLAMVSGLGLSDAAVQAKELGHEQASALFWLNAGLGLVMGLGCVAAGPFLGEYFREPTVPLVTAWAGLALFLNVLALQHRVQVTRAGRYGALAMADLVTQLGAGVAAIGMAALGYGWKALVGLFMIQAAARLGTSWWVAGWVPGWPRLRDVPIPTIRLGLVVCLGWIMSSLSAAAESAALGRVAGPGGLGLYTKAQQLARYPVMIFFVPAFLPAVHRLGKHQGDTGALSREYLRLQLWVMLLASLPIGVLAGIAPDFVPAVMGSQWSASVPLFLVLLVGTLAHPMAHGAMWALTARARKREMVFFQLWSGFIPIAAIVTGALLAGPAGACAGAAASMWFALVPAGALLARRAAALDIPSYATAMLRVVTVALACAAAGWLGRAGFGWLGVGHAGLRALLGALVGCIAWLAAARALSRAVLREVLETIAATLRVGEVRWVRGLIDTCVPGEA